MSKQADAADLLLLQGLLAHLPVGMLVNDANTLEMLYAKPPPPPGLADHLPLDQLLGSYKHEDEHPQLAPELSALIQEVAATGRPHHLTEFRHEPPGHEPRWWIVSLQRVETGRWGRVVVTLALDLTDQVRARRLLAEREARHQTLREAIHAVSPRHLVHSLQQVTDAVLPALLIEVATIRLLDAEANLHLVAASGLRPAETRRLALQPITPQQLEPTSKTHQLSLLTELGLRSVEVRWLEGRDGPIGILTIGARSKYPPSDESLALLDAAAAQLSNALQTIEQNPGYLRSRALEIARLSAAQDEATPIGANALRPRELEILRLYGEGLGTHQIAELLVLSPHTVRTHVRNARRRLSVNSRTEALDLVMATDAEPVI